MANHFHRVIKKSAEDPLLPPLKSTAVSVNQKERDGRDTGRWGEWKRSRQGSPLPYPGSELRETKLGMAPVGFPPNDQWDSFNSGNGAVVAKQHSNMIAHFTTALLSNRHSDHDYFY